MFGASKLKERMPRLAGVDTCPNVTLLEITCHSSFYKTESSNTKKISFRFLVKQWKKVIPKIFQCRQMCFLHHNLAKRGFEITKQNSRLSVVMVITKI